MENTKPKITLQALYQLFSTHPEGMWIMEAPNALDLYNWVKTHPIKKVLDLGLGIGLSASVVSLALRDKGEKDYHIDSVEQFDKCIKIAEQLIPKELKENITIHKSEVEIWNYEKIPYQYFSVYKTVPEGDYDLIINDGPAYFVKEEDLIDLPNGGIMKMVLENKIKAGTTIIYDGRASSLKLLERYLFDNFLTLRVPKQGSDFNVFERKDNPVAFNDIRLEYIKNNTPYFNEFKENGKP